MAINIIGLPWARAAVKIASSTLLHFGQKGVSRANYLGKRGYRPGYLITAIPLAVTMMASPSLGRI
jgi:uncharacterized membrane protein YccF (DUF307 family)